MNAKERERATRVIHREYKDAEGNIHSEYKDAEGNIHTEYKDTQGNIHSYQNGYIDGHLAEEQLQDMRSEGYRKSVERADKNISKGVLIGIIVTFVAGLTWGTIYFLTNQNSPQPVSVITVPIYKSPPTPQKVRVIEQPIIKIIQVPQAQAPRSTENKTAQSSIAKPSPTQGSITAAKPSNNSDASVPMPIAVSPSNSSVTSSNLNRTDSDIKNEILKQFQNNLPNNQLTVEVTNGDVTVSGTVETPDQLQQIQPLLKSIQGVEKVDMTATIVSQN